MQSLSIGKLKIKVKAKNIALENTVNERDNLRKNTVVKDVEYLRKYNALSKKISRCVNDINRYNNVMSKCLNGE